MRFYRLKREDLEGRVRRIVWLRLCSYIKGREVLRHGLCDMCKQSPTLFGIERLAGSSGQGLLKMGLRSEPEGIYCIDYIRPPPEEHASFSFRSSGIGVSHGHSHMIVCPDAEQGIWQPEAQGAGAHGVASKKD